MSVVIPAFNVQDYIRTTIQSALSQTYEDAEVIVVNDGSTDQTHDGIVPFLDQITYVRQSNRGLAGARNAALTHAQGEYVAMLDGDDVWFPDTLSKMVGFLDRHPETAILSADAFLMFGDQPSTDTYYKARPARLRFRDENQAYWIVQYNFILGFVLCRRSIFGRIGRFNEALRSYEDWDLWLRYLTSEDGKASLLPEPVGYYRIRQDGLTRDRRQLLEDEVTLLEMASSTKSGIKGLSGRLIYAKGKAALLQGDTKTAVQHFEQARLDVELPSHFRRRARLGSLAPKLCKRIYRG